MMNKTILPPKTKQVFSILPKEPLLLMGAGPVPIPEEVAKANSVVISHLGPTMKEIISNLREMGKYLFQTTSEKVFGISGPSSAAMEMAVTSLLYPGRKILVLNLGTFSARFMDLARGVGAEVIELKATNYKPFTKEEVERKIIESKPDVLAMVQGETSCGVHNIHMEEIMKLCKKHNVMTIADTVCTLSTMPFKMDDWGVSIAVTGGQKGLSTIAGMSLIAFSEEAFEFVSKREAPMPHWCLDPRRAWKFWGQGEYHYTAPVTGILAIYEGLRLITEETLEKRHERHAFYSNLLQESIEKMGLTLFTPKEYRLNSVLAINNPEGIDPVLLRRHMEEKYSVEISGAFGLNIVRIGQMGEQARKTNARRALEALGRSYEFMGFKAKTNEALEYFDRKAKARNE